MKVEQVSEFVDYLFFFTYNCSTKLVLFHDVLYFLFIILSVGAMMTIKTKYPVNRNWVGDPCLPVGFAWDGLNCTYNTRGVSRIIAL